MAILNLRVIRKTTEALDSERIFDETLWKQMKIFGIHVLHKKVCYHCTTTKAQKGGIGFKTK